MFNPKPSTPNPQTGHGSDAVESRTTGPHCRIKSFVACPLFVLAFAGIRRLVVQIKEIEKDDLVAGHGSDAVESAQREMNMWYNPSTLHPTPIDYYYIYIYIYIYMFIFYIYTLTSRSSLNPQPYRGTSLIRKRPTPRTSVGPRVYTYCRVLGGS